MPRRDPLEHRATPQPSLDQRLDALTRANEVRVLRAQLKRELKAQRAADLFSDEEILALSEDCATQLVERLMAEPLVLLEDEAYIEEDDRRGRRF